MTFFPDATKDSGGSWDTIWECEFGDWRLEAGSLTNDAELHSLIVLCLFTDRRAYEDDPLPDTTGDRRGWFGDFVDIDTERYERDLGSRIWIYERSVISEEVRAGIEDAAREALEVLTDQGLAARVEITAETDPANMAIFLRIEVFSQDGTLRYDQRFSRLWAQTAQG